MNRCWAHGPAFWLISIARRVRSGKPMSRFMKASRRWRPAMITERSTKHVDWKNDNAAQTSQHVSWQNKTHIRDQPFDPVERALWQADATIRRIHQQYSGAWIMIRTRSHLPSRRLFENNKAKLLPYEKHRCPSKNPHQSLVSRSVFLCCMF